MNRLCTCTHVNMRIQIHLYGHMHIFNTLWHADKHVTMYSTASGHFQPQFDMEMGAADVRYDWGKKLRQWSRQSTTKMDGLLNFPFLMQNPGLVACHICHAMWHFPSMVPENGWFIHVYNGNS